MNKEERLNVYKEMLVEFSSDDNRRGGYCSFLYHKDVNGEYCMELEEFPELMKQKPNKGWVINSEYWWKPRGYFSTNKANNPRTRALKRAIVLCEA